MNNNNKNIPGGSPKQSTIAGSFCWVDFRLKKKKKIITEVLLVLPLYLILFFIWWRFRPVIKAMASVENILNDYDSFWKYC